jgi:hypothetical protein
MTSEVPIDPVSVSSIINLTTMANVPNIIVDDPKEEVTPIFLQTQAAKGICRYFSIYFLKINCKRNFSQKFKS